MVRQIGSEAGMSRPGTLESTGVVHKFFQQSMETNWEFCWRLAAMNNFEFVVEEDKFHFRKREAKAAAAQVAWGNDLLGFRPRMSGVGQPKDVTVANFDPVTKQLVTGQAATAQVSAQTEASNGRSGVVGKLAGRLGRGRRPRRRRHVRGQAGRAERARPDRRLVRRGRGQGARQPRDPGRLDAHDHEGRQALQRRLRPHPDDAHGARRRPLHDVVRGLRPHGTRVRRPAADRDRRRRGRTSSSSASSRTTRTRTAWAACA